MRPEGCLVKYQIVCRKPVTSGNGTNVLSFTVYDKETTDWAVGISETPFLHYTSREDSTHTLTVAVTPRLNSTFTLDVKHVNTKTNWKELNIDFDFMPFHTRLLALFNGRSAVPARVMYTKASIPLTANLEKEHFVLNPEAKLHLSHTTDAGLFQMFNTVRAHIGADTLSCNTMLCTMEHSGDNSCACSRQLTNTDVKLDSYIHTQIWHAPDSTYPVPQCLLNCLYHHSNMEDDTHDQLEFYTSWSGYFKQLWKKPHLYTGHIFALYFLAVFVQQTLNICYHSVVARALTFLMMIAAFCITVIKLIPVFLCGQLISFHYILHMSDGRNESMFLLRLSQLAAFVATLLHPTLLVTFMFIPVYFYLADVLRYGKFYFNYFELPNTEPEPQSEQDAAPKALLDYYDPGTVKVSIKHLCDSNSLTEKQPCEKAEVCKKCALKSLSPPKYTASTSQKINSSGPGKQIVYGCTVMFNCVNVVFICILWYFILL